MMKKTLITTAVASAVSVMGFAAEVSIYGDVGSGFVFGSTDVSGTETDGKTMPNAENNVLVFTATEDLDNGMQAYGALTYTVTGTGHGNLSTRATRIGLRGDFGDAAFGMGEMIYEVGQIVDAHGTDYGGHELQLTDIAGGAFTFTRLDSNVFVYSMNALGSFKPTIVYGYGNGNEVTATDATNGGVSGAQYDDGLMQIAVDWNNGAGINAQFAYAAYTNVDPLSGLGFLESNNAGVADATGTRLTLRYDTGGVAVNGTYQQMELDHDAEATYDGNSLYSGKTIERDTMFFNVIVPVSTGRIAVGYGKGDDASVDGVSVAESGITITNLSYQYDLSPNTYLFARYGKSDTDQNYDINNQVENSTTSQVIGIKMSF
jgi:hypothetical protein